MERNLKLLKFPEIKQDLNQYRIEQALLSMSIDDEYEAIETLLVAIHNFLSTLQDTELMLYDITKLRASLEEYYDQQD